MNKTTLSPELDDVIRQSYEVPPVRSEFVNRTYDDLMKRADRKSMRSNRTVLRLRFGLGLAAVLLLFGLIFGQMPEGQALAESIRHFFKIAAVTEIPVTDPNLLSTPTLAPTFAVTLAPAVNTEPTKTPPPTPEGFTLEDTQACQTDPYGYRCKIAWAEKKAGFDVKEFPSDPLEMRFDELYIKDSNEVWIRYSAVRGGTYLSLVQRPDNGYTKYGVGVPEDSVQQVMVGEYPGEYVAGLFAVGMGETSYSWKQDGGKYSLRWADGERWFEIINFGCVGITQYCSEEELINLALTLVDKSAPFNGPRADFLKNVKEAEEISGFDVLEPGILPDGFKFSSGRYDKDKSEIVLSYKPADPDQWHFANLEIFQIPLDRYSYPDSSDSDNVTLEPVNINGHSGTLFFDHEGNDKYIFGSVKWQTDEWVFILTLHATDAYGGTFTREQVLEIARSVK
ncbi:MAG: DUF4367 domain-containing protein [Bellilinea sp.]